MIDAPKQPRPMRSKVAGRKAPVLRWPRAKRVVVWSFLWRRSASGAAAHPNQPAVPPAAEHADGANCTTSAGASEQPERQSWLPHVLFLVLLAVLVERVTALQIAVAALR